MSRSGHRRTRTASDQVSAALLDAAETVLDRDGAAGVTVRAVAQEAGVAPMGIYNRFDGKDGLLDALAVRAFDALALAIAVDAGPPPADRLRHACRGYRAFALSHPAQYALMFATGSPAAPRDSPVRARGRRVFDTLVGMVGDVTDPLGSSSAPDLDDTSQAVWYAIHGAVTIEIAEVGQTADAATTFERTLDLMVAALQAGPHVDDA